jgi:hypothetical protein
MVFGMVPPDRYPSGLGWKLPRSLERRVRHTHRVQGTREGKDRIGPASCGGSGTHDAEHDPGGNHKGVSAACDATDHPVCSWRRGGASSVHPRGCPGCAEHGCRAEFPHGPDQGGTRRAELCRTFVDHGWRRS